MATRNTSATIWISMPSSPVRSRHNRPEEEGAPRRSARTLTDKGSRCRRFIDRAYVNSPS
jgi:hypothetical protein